MIYAIILIVLALIVILFNKKAITQKTAGVLASIAPLFIIWGTVGIVILNTARISVFHEKPIYWVLLIVGSAIEVIMGILLVSRYFKMKKGANCDCSLYLNILAYVAIVVAVATFIAF